MNASRGGERERGLAGETDRLDSELSGFHATYESPQYRRLLYYRVCRIRHLQGLLALLAAYTTFCS